MHVLAVLGITLCYPRCGECAHVLALEKVPTSNGHDVALRPIATSALPPRESLGRVVESERGDLSCGHAALGRPSGRGLECPRI